MRSTWLLWLILVALLFLRPSASEASPEDSTSSQTETERATILKTWKDGLEVTRYSRMAFLFAVTFMNIDIADIEARFAANDAAVFETLVKTGKPTDDRILQVAATAMKADPCAFRFTFCRDGGIDRFMKGMQKGLEAAREDSFISEPEFLLVWDWVRLHLTTLEDRGLNEKDQFLFRIVGNETHMIFLGADDTVLFDTINSSQGCARGIKGIFLAEDSKFKEQLIQSLWQD